MIPRRLGPPPRGRRRSGFTLIEATLSVLVVALVVTTSLEAAAASARAQASMRERQLAASLAEGLLSEIIAARYVTPTDTTGLLKTLTNALDRSNFLGIDAYAGFTESPPRSRDGTAIVSDNSWSRTVSVAFVTPSDPTALSVSDLGLCRVTVTVSRNGRVVATRSTLRALD